MAAPGLLPYSCRGGQRFFLGNWCRAERTLKALNRVTTDVGNESVSGLGPPMRHYRGAIVSSSSLANLPMLNAAPKSSLLMAMNTAAFRVGAKAIEDALKAARLLQDERSVVLRHHAHPAEPIASM